MKMLMEGSDFAKKIHVTDLATHVGYMPENPYDPKYEEVLVACKAILWKNARKTVRTSCSKQDRKLR